jgi:4-aminobutyrate aminotransferase-like enzyme
VLLILDEIFTGLYRTGARFCCLAEDIEPDIILLGKALGGGLALGVCAGRSDVMNAFGPSQGEAIHTETFLGNPLTMAVAGVVLDVMERDGFSDQVNKRGMQLRTILDQIAQNLGARAAGVVGRGMMLGIPIVDPEHGRPDPNTVSKIVTSSLNQQLILLGGGIHGNVLQFIPPLTINVEELEFLETQLTATLAPWME